MGATVTTIYSIGHSTRGAEEFRELLQQYDVKLLCDVRQFAMSRRYPHFSAQALAASLAEVGIDYVHEVDLGGRRRGRADSPNAYWKNTSFRAYADHMATPAFQAALERLIAIASKKITAIMCAEAVPWRCHRWLISDALVARGIVVRHIIDERTCQEHVLNPSAQVGEDGAIHYPAAGGAEPARQKPLFH